MNPGQRKFEEQKKAPFQVQFNPSKHTNSRNNELNALLEANISEVDLEFDDGNSDYDNSSPADPFNNALSEYLLLNFSEDSFKLPENPFVHWSIYR